MDQIITTKGLSFSYGNSNEGNSHKVLKNINLDIKKGQFIAILGRNGSGKSTLARMFNALLIPGDGVVEVAGIDTSKEEYLWDVRRVTGMIFQNPDNQIVATTVEEDIAFGLENIGVEPSAMKELVDEAAEATGVLSFLQHAPHMLSGGQKQRVAIAGILAMKPACIVLDEATSMLDPAGRKEVMKVLAQLNKEDGITIIHITHHMDEVKYADRVIIMEEGEIALDCPPDEIFADVEAIRKLGLDVPQVTEIIYQLNEFGYRFPKGLIDVNKAAGLIIQRLLHGG